MNGMFGLTAVNHCIARIDTSVGFGFVSATFSTCPFAGDAREVGALPFR